MKTVSSKSQLTDPKAERFAVLLATMSVNISAAAYVLLMFFSLPLAIHHVVTTNNGECTVGEDPYNESCVLPTTASQTTYTLILTMMRVVTFCFGNLLGAIGDKFGRRPVMLIAICGYACTGIFFIIGWSGKSIVPFFIGALFLGFCAPMTPHAVGYAADVSTPDRAAGNLGVVQGAGLLGGLTLGAVLSSVITISDPRKVMENSFYAGSGLAVIGFVVLLLLLPESLHKEDRNDVGLSLKLHSPFGIFFVAFRNPYLFCIWFTGLCNWIVAGANEAVFLGWWARRYGASSTIAIVTFLVYGWVLTGFGTGIMTKVYVAMGGIKFAVHFSCLMAIIAAAVVATAPTIQMSYIGATLGFVAGPSVPAVLSVLMGQVGPKEKGLMSGTYRTSEALGKFCGSIVFGTMFAQSIDVYRPDPECIPEGYPNILNDNNCDCGVESCPDMTSGAPVWTPALCTLGELSHRWHESPSKTIKKNTSVALGAHYWMLGASAHGDECSTLGGATLLSAPVIGFNVSLPRLWCATGNPIAGCGPGGEFSLGMVGSDAAKLGTNETMYHSDIFGALEIAGNVMAGNDSCPDSGTLDLELCWADVISPFPGLIPMAYGVGVLTAGYISFAVGELLFKGHEFKIVPLNEQE